MLGDPPTPWWVAKDVCDILGYSNVTDTLNKHLDEDERSTLAIREGTSPKGGNPNMNVINESGLYCLILRSNMPKAKEFRKWVTTTVLPQVMREGLPDSQCEGTSIADTATNSTNPQLSALCARLRETTPLPARLCSTTSRACLQYAGTHGTLLSCRDGYYVNPVAA